MGTLEKKYRERRKRADLQELILSTVSAVGLISAALIAPNVLVALSKLGMVPSARQTDSIRTARTRMVKRGLLKWEGNKLRLTEAGEKKLRYLSLRDYQLPKPKKWDERWRVLVFDIPEKRKGLREKIRTMLVMVGFVRLQDSVWIYPYDCEDLITLLKADFKIGKDMLYMIVDTLEYDKPIRETFGLYVR
jgi:DNA-binding transcriptional regulator PaaX